MSFVETIEIKNFKSIRHQKIEGCKKINVFIGYPNVGKSNILEALSLFCITNLTNFKDYIRVKEDPTLFFNGFLSNNIEVKINKSFRITCRYINSQLQIVLNYLGENGNDKLQPALRDNFFNKFVQGASMDPQATVEEIKFKKYEFRKLNLTTRNQYTPLNIPFGDNIFDVIQGNEIIYDQVSALFKVYDLELLYDATLQAFTILKRANKGILTIPYELIADTLQRLIFYKAAILSNSDTVLLFEEPEAHMFPPYIRQFTTDVIFDKSNQFFIATHSPYVLDTLIEDAQNDLAVFLVDYEKGETIVRSLSADDILEVRNHGVDLFFNLESYLKHGKVNNA